MILSFITLTNDIEKVPVWGCVEQDNGKKSFVSFISTPAFPKRIMLFGPAEESYTVTDPVEVSKGVFVSTLEIPYNNISVAGDDLRPFINHFAEDDELHRNVAIISIDRTVYTYLDSGVAPSAKFATPDDSVILNTFHAKEWCGCIAVIGRDFERGNYNPPRMVGMYIDYAIIGEAKSKMLHELHITENPDNTGITVEDGLVEGGMVAKRLLEVLNGPKKRSFRIQTTQRLSNIVVVPDTIEDAKAIFDEAPADYVENPYGIQIYPVSVDEEGNITDDVTSILNLFKRDKANHNRSVIFYGCKPSSDFFKVNLSYIFVANSIQKGKRGSGSQVSYLSVVCP